MRTLTRTNEIGAGSAKSLAKSYVAQVQALGKGVNLLRERVASEANDVSKTLLLQRRVELVNEV